ncbi:MAG: ribonuclease P protein component [Halocynthiibacter sp.]
MTPPDAPATGSVPELSERPSAVFVRLKTLKSRPDFLRCARAARKPMPGFLLQARRRGENEAPADEIRVGFTCSKKIGNAVVRSRAKRRLRDVARARLSTFGRPGWDYVLVGRPGATVTRDFADLLSDLANALAAIHGPHTGPPAR